MPDVITFEETPESKATREAIDRLVITSPDAAVQALHEIIGRQERDAVSAWRTQSTPGGEPWAPNAKAYTEWKENVLGQRPPMIGIVTGTLRQSVSAEMNDAALEGRVGSSVEYAEKFSKRRRFLPTIEKATADARKIVERILARTISATGLTGTGAEV